MGQTGSVAERSDSRCSKTCTSCADWGEKDLNTVKISTEQLPALLGAKTSAKHEAQKEVLVATGTDKENEPPSFEEMARLDKVNYDEAITKARDKLKDQQEQAAAARETEAQLIEKQQNEILQRVREELQRVKDEQDRQRENERLERENERHVSQLRLNGEKKMLAEYERQRKEESKRLAEEARQKKEEADEKREQVRAWLRKNGFKDANELKRKMLHKVRPLHVAVQKSDVALVKLLLSAGADVNMTDGNNETALTLAARVNKKEHNSIKSEAVLRVLSERLP